MSESKPEKQERFPVGLDVKQTVRVQENVIVIMTDTSLVLTPARCLVLKERPQTADEFQKILEGEREKSCRHAAEVAMSLF